MDTRAIATGYRMAQWTQALQERASKGESIKEFCQSKGVSRNTYFYWQRKLRETATKQITQENAADSQALVPNGWAVCEEARAESEPEESSVSIEIGKCRVKAGADTSPELLAKVCRVLTSLC
jgi:hypothetical protein